MMTAAQLYDKWHDTIEQAKIHDRFPIPTWTEPATLALCCEVADQSKFMVEVGTYIGASARVMLTANPKLHLWCVDIFSAFAFNKEVAEIFLHPYIASGRCELIVGDSKRGGQMLSYMAGRIDAAWVDDGHATEDVMRDIDSFKPLIKPGGILFGHDFDINPFNNVAQGVLNRIPMAQLNFPVPRVWMHYKT